jgi:hypothetical protein
VAQAVGGGVAGLVDVQVDGEAVLGGQGEESVEVRVQARAGLRDEAEDAAVLGHEAGELVAGRAVVVGGHGERHALEFDPARPTLARLGEDGPGDRRLGRQGVEVGADGPRPVGVGAAERELHARRHVAGRPVRLAVATDGLQRAHEAAVGVAGARPDVALVEVGVHVHRARPDDPAGEVDPARASRSGRVVGGDARDAAVRQREVEQQEAVVVPLRRRRARRLGQAGRHAGADEGGAGRDLAKRPVVVHGRSRRWRPRA